MNRQTRCEPAPVDKAGWGGKLFPGFEGATSGILESLFDACFYAEHRTRLRGGAAEPVYRPADSPGRDHLIYYREDFFASALHEVAHWCIAGRQRRTRVDYGYWYCPDGRSAAQQRRFEQVECRPQALEWHFALAARATFRVSADNLAAARDSGQFADRVLQQARLYCDEGLPERAQRFRASLARRFGGPANPAADDFNTGAA